MSQQSRNIEVIKGNGENLDFSPVYKHLSTVKPKTKKEASKNIVIPDVKNKKANK